MSNRESNSFVEYLRLGAIKSIKEHSIQIKERIFDISTDSMKNSRDELYLSILRALNKGAKSEYVARSHKYSKDLLTIIFKKSD